MCGTIMQILGEGVALMLIDRVIQPVFGGGFMIDMFLYLIKGFTTYYIYKWFQCSESGVIRHPLAGVSFWTALLGGVVGMFTLAITGSVLNENTYGESGFEELIIYGIEAVILNIVYGVTSTMVHDLARNSLRNYL